MTVVAEINLIALQHNFQRAKALAGSSALIATVKANAYGHGLRTIAMALPEADGFGVGSISEALLLREAGITQRIVLYYGVQSAEELSLASHYNLDVAVYNLKQVELLATASLRQPVSVWLRLETGMHMLGITAAELPAAWATLQQAASVRETVLMSHFACADSDSEVTAAQGDTFTKMTSGLKAKTSLANSAALLLGHAKVADFVRPGIMLFGASPIAGKVAADFGLQPVMRLSSRLIDIRSLQAGEAIGYGATYVASKTQRVGILAAGYSDAYPFQGSQVCLDGVMCRVLGRVAMDMVAIDLSAVPQAELGDSAVLWGPEFPVEHLAESCQTIPYDLLCATLGRVRQVVIEAPAQVAQKARKNIA